jgi:hypothetical protein
VNEAEYKRLKKQAEQAKADHDRAQGQLDSALERMAEEFGCTTLAEAKTLQAKLDKAEAKAAAHYEKACAAFEAEWGGRLEGDDE